ASGAGPVTAVVLNSTEAPTSRLTCVASSMSGVFAQGAGSLFSIFHAPAKLSCAHTESGIDPNAENTEHTKTARVERSRAQLREVAPPADRALAALRLRAFGAALNGLLSIMRPGPG